MYYVALKNGSSDESFFGALKCVPDFENCVVKDGLLLCHTEEIANNAKEYLENEFPQRHFVMHFL